MFTTHVHDQTKTIKGTCKLRCDLDITPVLTKTNLLRRKQQIFLCFIRLAKEQNVGHPCPSLENNWNVVNLNWWILRERNKVSFSSEIEFGSFSFAFKHDFPS